MLGTIVNVCAIISGSLTGSVTKRGIKKEYEVALLNSIGLCACLLGISTFCSSISKSSYPVLFILSISIGTLIGTVFDIDNKFNKLTSKIGGSDLAKGLTTAILLFCIGTLSILGPVQSALYHNNTFLYTNAALDFVTSAILSCAYGFKIAYSAIALFIWQGSIYFISLYLGNIISDKFFFELSVVGGILILSSGLSILKIKDLKTLNMLPSLFVVPVFWAVIHFIKAIFYI